MSRKRKSSAEIVRSWRDNINQEARTYGRDPALQQAPVLVFVGGKVLYWDELLSNIALAVEAGERRTLADKEKP